MALAAFFEEEGQIQGLIEVIQKAAKRDVLISEGKALSQQEEAVLMALDILTRDTEELVWIKANDLRERVRDLLGYSDDRMGAALWIEHILKRLQLTDRTRRKAYSGGQMYFMERGKLLDMMQSYEVEAIDD